MKSVTRMLATATLMVAASLASAEGKIAVLNIQEAILNTEVAQGRLQALRAEAEYAENRKQLEALGKEHDAAAQQLQKDLAVMSNDQKAAATKKLQEKRADIEHVARKLQAAEQELGQALIQELAPKLQQVVTELIKTEGIGLLIDRKAALHADSSFSITAKVTDKLNQMK